MSYATLTSNETGANSLTDINANFALAAPLASPTFTGTVTLPASTTLVTPILGVATATTLNLNAGTTTVAPLILAAGTNMTTPTVGVNEFDGVSFYNTVDTTNGRRNVDCWNLFRLAANGNAISTIADFFGSTDGIPTVLNGVYEIEWDVYFTVATGGTSTFTIVSTQSLTNMVADWKGSVITGIAATGALSGAAVVTQTATSVALPVTGALSAASHHYVIHAIVEAAAAGNIRLRQTMSAGTSTPLRGSYFKVRRLPAGNAGTYVA